MIWKAGYVSTLHLKNKNPKQTFRPNPNCNQVSKVNSKTKDSLPDCFEQLFKFSISYLVMSLTSSNRKEKIRSEGSITASENTKKHILAQKSSKLKPLALGHRTLGNQTPDNSLWLGLIEDVVYPLVHSWFFYFWFFLSIIVCLYKSFQVNYLCVGPKIVSLKFLLDENMTPPEFFFHKHIISI